MRFGCLALLALWVAATPADAQKRVLFDNFHAETAGNADWVIDTQQPLPVPDQSTVGPATPRTYWTGAISSWGIDLVKRGYTVATNTTALTYGNAGNPYDLANYDVLIVPEPNTLFTATEATAILNYVQDGGGLVAVGDHYGSDRNNDGQDSPRIWNAMDPTQLLGIHWGVSGDANNSISQASSNVNSSASDSVTHGPEGTVLALAFYAGTTMTLNPAANPNVRGEVWMNGLPQTSLTGLMAASTVYGNGRAVFVGDSSPADDGSANSGNSNIFDGWGDATATDSTFFVNATHWVARRPVVADPTPPTVSLSSPVGGEVWKAGSTHAIIWNASDNVGVSSVDLAYSTNGGASFPNSIASGLANSGSYSWAVPNAPGTTVRVRVRARDAAGNLAADSSAANFTIDRWTIQASAGANGTITPSGTLSLVQGASQGFTIAAAACYQIANVVVDGGSKGAVSSYTFSSVAANHTISATFVGLAPYTITASAGMGGSMSPSGAVSVACGASQGFTISADPCYQIANVVVDGASKGAIAAYSFTGVAANHTISASFSALGPYTIVASAEPSGSISPSGGVSVACGASRTFTIVPDACAQVEDVIVDGSTVGAVTTYTFDNVTGGHTIDVTFASGTYTLDVGTAGAGTVARSPDQPSYACGSSIELSATPDEGCAFTGWTGDTTDTANPLSLVLVRNLSVVATFADVQAPLVLLTAPVGGEHWPEASLQTVTWTAGDNTVVDSVNVDYSLTGAGGPWFAVAHGLANSGSVAWTLPEQATDSALVRVTGFDRALNTASATSDSLFYIVNPNLVVGEDGPGVLMLACPQPNPSSGAAELHFSLPQAGRARIEILDLAGRRVWARDGDLGAGRQSWRWDGITTSGTRADAGLYFVRLVTPWGNRTGRLARLK